DGYGTVDLGSNTFRYYGNNYTGANQLFVVTNGYITLGGTDAAVANNFTNGPLGTGSPIAPAAIAPLWDDLGISASAPMLARLVLLDGSGNSDYLTIQRQNAAMVSPTGTATVQAWLQLNTGTNNGDILFNYIQNPNGRSTGVSATVGIKNSNTAGP